MTGVGGISSLTGSSTPLGVPAAGVYAIFAAVLVIAVVVAAQLGRRSGRRQLSQRLNALGTRLGLNPPEDENNLETSLSYLEQVTGAATEAVTSSSADAIRLRRSLDTLSQGVVLCDENGTVVYRNPRASALMVSRHGDALAAQQVTTLLEDAWHEGSAEHTIDLYGPPRRTLTVRATLIDDGRRPLGVMALIEDVSERRRLDEIRRDFVANVSHELKTPMGALGLLAETLVSEPDAQVARRLADRIHTEAFRVSRIIDDLLDLSRIESEEAPPREPVMVNLVMAEAVERVRSTAEQRGIELVLVETDPPVAVLGDRRQLVSALHALLENAVTYSYDHSTVTISGTVVLPHDRRGAEEGRTPPVPEPAGEGPDGSPEPAGRVPVSDIDTDPGITALPSATGPAAPASSAMRATTRPGSLAHHEESGGDGEGWRADVNRSPGAGDGGRASAAASGSGPGPGDGPARPPEMPRRGEMARAAAQGADSGWGQPSDGGRDGGRHDRPMVHIKVADHGIGIPARDLDRIFERFYRVDHGRSRDTGGTGLGLSIVRHVANNHQGWVEVESREGEGSTFTLVLPLADPSRGAASVSPVRTYRL